MVTWWTHGSKAKSFNQGNPTSSFLIRCSVENKHQVTPSTSHNPPAVSNPMHLPGVSEETEKHVAPIQLRIWTIQGVVQWRSHQYCKGSLLIDFLDHPRLVPCPPVPGPFLPCPRCMGSFTRRPRPATRPSTTGTRNSLRIFTGRAAQRSAKPSTSSSSCPRSAVGPPGTSGSKGRKEYPKQYPML